MDGEKFLKRERKKYRWIKWFMILVLCIFIGAVIIKTYREEENKPNFKDLTLSEAVGNPGEYCFLDVEYMTEEFAIYGKYFHNKYYFIMSDGNIYIANVKESLLNSLQPIIDATYVEETFADKQSIRIYGITESPDDTLKEFAVNAYNKIFATNESEKITLEDYDFYFGNVILNTKVEYVDTTIEEIVILCTIIIEIFMAMILAVISSNIRKSNKYIKKYEYEDTIAKELNNEKYTTKFKKNKIIITKNFLIDSQSGLSIVKFSDVKWWYKISSKTLWITTSTCVIFKLFDGTQVEALEYRGKGNEEFRNIINIIEKKLPKDCMNGFTKENKKAYKEYKENL